MSPEQVGERELRAALAALNEGDVQTADAIARRLSHDRPDDPAAHQLLAIIALRQGDVRQAADSAATSLALRPDHGPTLVVAGRAARASQNAAAAIAFFRRAAALEPDRAEAAFLLCVTLLECGDTGAQTLLPHLLQKFPHDAEGWRLLGEALHSAGQRDAALVAFTRAAQAAPSLPLHMRRGALLEVLGRTAEAAEAYWAAASLAPDDGEAALRLGLCLRRVGDGAGAAAAIERAVLLQPANAEAWFATGLIHQDRRGFHAAAEAYQHALDAAPGFAEAAVNLGTCRQETGDIIAAKAAYRVALRHRPDTFGRIAQALAVAPAGEVWLDAAALRRSLAG